MAQRCGAKRVGAIDAIDASARPRALRGAWGTTW